MADNLNVPGGSAGPVATDEIGGIHYQRVKLVEGADGVNDGDISAANPLPVTSTALAVVGGGTQATALRVTIASDSSGVLSVDDNGSSLTTDSAQLPASLGQKTKAASMSVTLASDQTLPSGQSYAYIAGSAIGMTAITYDDDDVVGDLVTFANTANTKAFRLKSVTMRAYHTGTAAGSYLLVFFSSNPASSTFTNGDAFSIHTDDKVSVSGYVPFGSSDFTTTGSGGTFFGSGVKAFDYILGSSGTLYMVVVAQGTISGTADSLEISIGVQQDA